MLRQSPLKVFRAKTQPTTQSDAPVYLIQDGRFFRTIDHEQGWSEKPDYELKPDGLVYRTEFHPMGISKAGVYRFGKDGMLYPTEEETNLPEFQIKDE